MPPGHGHTPEETFCIANVLPGEVASEEIEDKRKIAFRELYSRMSLPNQQITCVEFHDLTRVQP